MSARDLFNDFLLIYRDPFLQLDEREIWMLPVIYHSSLCVGAAPSGKKETQEIPGSRLCVMCCIVVLLDLSTRLQAAQKGGLHYACLPEFMKTIISLPLLIKATALVERGKYSGYLCLPPGAVLPATYHFAVLNEGSFLRIEPFGRRQVER